MNDPEENQPVTCVRARCAGTTHRPDARRGSVGKRGRACRGDRRGVVHRGRGLANRLARRSEAGAETARLRRGFRREKAPQIRRERFTAGSTEIARRARQTARVDRETRVRGRVRGVSREYPPEPARDRSHLEGLPVPSDASNAIFPNAPDTLARRGTFLSRRGGGDGRGARGDRCRARAPAISPVPHRRSSPRVPAPGGAFGRACPPARPARPASPHFR